MDADIQALLRPVWGAEQWIMEGWEALEADERKIVTERMALLFKEGLPFALKHDKLLYIYTFSLLAQLEVLAIQVPLKFTSKLTKPLYRERMRVQLVDEVFHGLVFTRIVYILCSPLSEPPPYNASIEELCNFIRHENCPKMALMLLNLVAEGWIEELFKSLKLANIAPNVFEIIIEDEHRHVSEAELYRDIGLPKQERIQKKLAALEEHLLKGVFMQYKYMASVSTLLGVEGVSQFMTALDEKHRLQLKKINLMPTNEWSFFMAFWQESLPAITVASQMNYEIKHSAIRQVFMTQWDNPSDPTMSGQFEVNVSCLDFFGKTFPKETLTTLMLQAISEMLMEQDIFRRFLSFHRLYQSDAAYVGVVVKLPECGDHLGTIVFENCHLVRVDELAIRIRQILSAMTYCYQKRKALEREYPHFERMVDDALMGYHNESYGYPLPGYPFVSVSNIGFCGFTDCMSPLRRNEALKFTLLKVTRRQIWNESNHSFEIQDILPVSISADHRIYDANTPVPKLTALCFERAFHRMIAKEKTAPSLWVPQGMDDEEKLMHSVDTWCDKNPEFAYRGLSVLQTYWFDFLKVEQVLTSIKEVNT